VLLRQLQLLLVLMLLLCLLLVPVRQRRLLLQVHRQQLLLLTTLTWMWRMRTWMLLQQIHLQKGELHATSACTLLVVVVFLEAQSPCFVLLRA
jgi:hypothetical protein